MTEMITWCEPFLQACRGERKDARVRKDEIPTALEYFKKKLGHEPTRLYLNDKMIIRLEDVIPEGIEIIEFGGVSSWEIWASASDGFPQPHVLAGPVSPNPPDSTQDKQDARTHPLTLSFLPPTKTAHIQKSKKTPLNQNLVRSVTKKRVKVSKIVTVRVKGKVQQPSLLPFLDERIKKLYRRGKTLRERSSRTIAAKLNQEGFKVSHMTVSRRILGFVK